MFTCEKVPESGESNVTTYSHAPPGEVLALLLVFNERVAEFSPAARAASRSRLALAS